MPRYAQDAIMNQGQGGGMGFNPMAAGGMMAGAGLGSMLAPWHNPASGASDIISQIPGAIGGYYDPYMNAGKQSLPILQQQYGNLVNDPGGMLNRIGGGFQQSPGFKFALDQALQGAGHAAAAGGMAGTPQHEQQNMNIATQLGNQDYYNWLNQATGMYNTGLGGFGGLAGMGFNASKSMADQIAQAMAAQAKLEYEGQNAANQHSGGGWGSLLGGLGTIAGSAFGGPLGGMAGGALGGALGSAF